MQDIFEFEVSGGKGPAVEKSIRSCIIYDWPNAVLCRDCKNDPSVFFSDTIFVIMSIFSLKTIIIGVIGPKHAI